MAAKAEQRTRTEESYQALRKILDETLPGLPPSDELDRQLSLSELSQSQVGCIKHWNALLQVVGAAIKRYGRAVLRPLPSFPIWGYELDPWNRYPIDSGAPGEMPDEKLALWYLEHQLPTACTSGFAPPSWAELVAQESGLDWFDRDSHTTLKLSPQQWLDTHRGTWLTPFIKHWRGDWPRYASSRKEWPRWKVRFLEQNRAWADEKMLGYLNSRALWKGTDYQDLRDWLNVLMEKPHSLRKLEWNCKGEGLDLWSHILQFRPSGLRVKRLKHVPALVAMTTTQIPIVPRSVGELADTDSDKPRGRFILRAEALQLQGFPAQWNTPASRVSAFKALGNAVHVGLVERMVQAWLFDLEGPHDRNGSPLGTSIDPTQLSVTLPLFAEPPTAL